MKNFLFLIFAITISFSGFSISVDSIGQIRGKITDKEMRIDISALAQGNYFIVVAEKGSLAFSILD